MLTAKPQLNLRNAREYFREHLSAGDYYAQGQQVRGEWFGQGAEKLGLKGSVRESDFLALCEGLNPATGRRLTARRNSERIEDGSVLANRRVFYDFTLSPPKSVSVAALLCDTRIVDLHEQSVRTAISELERFAQTRVRTAGLHTDRDTGNVVGASFRHDTSRELDPHLHTHCVLFNATWDTAERRWKALQAAGMYGAQRFVENLYYHELCRGLHHLGYSIENNARDFELRGVPASAIARFSKRHQQIDRETSRRIEREGLRGRLKELRGQVAATSRQRKVKDSTAERLRSHWTAQLPADEAKALAGIRPRWKLPWKARESETPDLAAVIGWADEHVFERKAVVAEHELWSAALGRARGANLDLAAIQAEIRRRGYLCETGTRRLTSPEVLDAEMAVVLAARQGHNWLLPLNPAFGPSAKLSTEQRAAVQRILGSQDFITLFRGGAGTGKSFALAEVKRGLEAAGHPVVVLAPQRQQVAALRSDGLPADTLAQCLQREAIPPNAVVVIDEAGQVGARQMSRLVALTQARHGRLILSGDTRQHGAVDASDALLAIERYSGTTPAVIGSIRRQDPGRAASAAERRRISAYKAAVKAASEGRIADSFERLDRLGWIVEAPLEERLSRVASEYVERAARGERPLVIAQTWTDVNALNDAIRYRLAERQLLSRGHLVKSYHPADLGSAQKRDPRFYDPSHVAFFVQRYGRFAKGDLAPIAGAHDRGLILLKDGRRSTISFRYADRMLVATERELEIASGDRLQITFNARSADGRPITNGELVTVRELRQDGALLVESDAGGLKTLGPDQRLFRRGYCVTSYASQGKTVDTVLVSDCGCQAVADRRHWYVAISRGRKSVLVFTSDKESLRANIEHAGDRPLALDLDLGCLPRWGERASLLIERERLHRDLFHRTAAPARREQPRIDPPKLAP